MFIATTPNYSISASVGSLDFGLDSAHWARRQAFRNNAIDIDVLPDLTDADLATLEHVRVRQNRHLQSGHNGGCVEDAVIHGRRRYIRPSFGRCGCRSYLNVKLL